MPQTALERWLKQSGVSVQPQSVIENAATSKSQSEAIESSAISSTAASNAQTERSHDDGTLPDWTAKQHANVTMLSPNKDNITTFKRMNNVLLPIPYPESFYKEILTNATVRSLTLLAYWTTDGSKIASNQSKQLIGGISCRILNTSMTASNSEGPMLYISTLVLLAPYRGLGIAQTMLTTLIKQAIDEHRITSIGAHVWDSNEAGIEWYNKRGFQQVNHEEHYYRKLRPSGAKVMMKQVSVLDFR